MLHRNLTYFHVSDIINQPGGIIEKEAYIDISNVMLFDITTQKGGRVGYRKLENGRKVRYFKSTGDVIDVDEG